MMRVAERWIRYLREPEDGASLAFFRFCFGAIMLWEVFRYWSGGRISRYYIEPGFYFSFVPFIKPWVGSGMYWHFAVLGALSILIAIGLFYRAAAALFCAAFTYVFLLDKSNYLNHLYLVCLVSFLMILVPANRVASVDRRLFFPTAPETVPRWSRLLLKAQIALVYFYGGIAKLNADWLRGEPVGSWIAERSDLPVIGPLLEQPWAGLAFAYAGLLIDLSLGFLLFFRRTFVAGAVIAVMFNTLNAIIFSIGIFPYFMIASLSLFPDPAWPRRLLGQFARAEAALGAPINEDAGKTAISSREKVLLGILHVYMIVQLALPLRHWFYPGDVHWNEEGHRFSWRMKLRDKDVQSFGMRVIDPRTGAEEFVDPEQWLTDRQFRKMLTRPDMIAQFAEHVADLREVSMGVRPIVKVEVMASLNGGPFHHLINPEANLAAADPGQIALPE
ncbi:MAG: HTTM domain-containing protein [Polyangiaceae bacterium]|nr:HTTM domain-containing protein [Polyangiaceae bacterium]